MSKYSRIVTNILIFSGSVLLGVAGYGPREIVRDHHLMERPVPLIVLWLGIITIGALLVAWGIVRHLRYVRDNRANN